VAVTLWHSNVQGAPNQDDLRSALRHATRMDADVVVLTETHWDKTRAKERVSARSKFGHAFATASHTTTPNTAGVAIYGPAGRVASAVLRAGSTDVLIIGVYGHSGTKRASKAGRAALADALAVRAAAADLPTVMIGDWCIDYSRSRSLTTLDAKLGPPVSDELSAKSPSDHVQHCTEFAVGADADVTSLRRHHPLAPPASKALWLEAWERAATTTRLAEAAAGHDPSAYWQAWSDTLELSAGVPQHSLTRSDGDDVRRWTKVWKSAADHANTEEHRQPVAERRLRRVYRRLLQYGNIQGEDAALSASLARSLGSLVSDGNPHPATYDDAVCSVRRAIRAFEEEVIQSRLNQWRHQQQHHSMTSAYAYVRNAANAPPAAATDPTSGRLSGGCAASIEAAKRAWDAKMAAPPDTSSLDQYFAEAARYVAPVRPCVECGGKRHLEWDRFTVAGLKAAACGCRGTAAGPTDYDADFLLSMPTPAWQHLADLADMIMGTGIWPDALRAQNVTFIPKISSQDLRPIAVIPVVTRTLSRCLVQHYRFWTTRVQSTDAVGQLLRFEAAVTARIADNRPTVARTSDLASRFNHIDPSLAERAAVLHGMPDTHAHFLFSVNVDKPTILRGGEYAMRAPPPDSGLAQGDPNSPVGAAVVAATHKAILKSTVDGLQYFDTYVDDRTALTNSLEADRHYTLEVARLDRLTGQREDPKKGSMAAVFLTNGADRADSTLPLPLPLTSSRADNHIDTDIEVAARAPNGGQGSSRRMAMVRATMSLWRWDAPWVMADDTDLHSMRYDRDKTITGRQRHWAWRHGGAFWLTTDKGWLVEPFAVQFSAERSAFMLHGWHDQHRPQLCTLAYRVLNYKLAVFRPWHAAWLAAAASGRQQQQ
ncbi:unnamed protein product, partial [Prorocentrum cordatum]